MIHLVCKHFNKTISKALIFVYLMCIIKLSYSQPKDSTHNNIKKVISAEAGLYAISVATLSSAWYSKFDHSSFHWFNDNGEWMQLDKAGHTFASYQSTRLAYEIHCYAGFSKKESLIWSSMAAFIAVSSIEIFDGFAKEWGASVGDLGANALGTGAFALQQGLFDKQIVKVKFSYHPTNFYKQRPQLLGTNFVERLIKDYNAQQYWLSVNLHDLLKWNFLPQFLNISFGYGATNMIAATPSNSINPDIIPFRRFFISPDIDLEKIKTRSKLLKGSLKVLNAFKIPLPTVEFNKQKTSFYWLF